MAEHPFIKTPGTYVAAIIANMVAALFSLFLFSNDQEFYWAIFVILFIGLTVMYISRYRRFLRRRGSA